MKGCDFDSSLFFITNVLYTSGKQIISILVIYTLQEIYTTLFDAENEKCGITTASEYEKLLEATGNRVGILRTMMVTSGVVCLPRTTHKPGLITPFPFTPRGHSPQQTCRHLHYQPPDDPQREILYSTLQNSVPPPCLHDRTTPSYYIHAHYRIACIRSDGAQLALQWY